MAKVIWCSSETRVTTLLIWTRVLHRVRGLCLSKSRATHQTSVDSQSKPLSLQTQQRVYYLKYRQRSQLDIYSFWLVRLCRTTFNYIRPLTVCEPTISVNEAREWQIYPKLESLATIFKTEKKFSLRSLASTSGLRWTFVCIHNHRFNHWWRVILN